MSSQGPNLPTDVAGFGWTGTANVEADDGSYATLDHSASTAPIVARSFGFTIPLSATILGVEVEIKATSQNGGVSEDVVELEYETGPLFSDNKAGNVWPTTSTIFTFGGPTDMWGISWTPAQFNDDSVNGFHVFIRLNLVPTGDLAMLDYVKVTIYYQEATGISVSDGLDISIAESISYLPRLSIPDTLGVSLTESSALVSRVSLTESLDAAVGDTVSGGTHFTVTDTLDVAVADVPSIVNRFSLAESINVSIDDSAGFLILSHLSLSETLGVSFTTESVSVGQHFPLTISDGLNVSLTETLTTKPRISLTETLNVSLGETTALKNFLEIDEPINVAANDQIPINTSFLTVGDTAGIGVTEAFASFRQATIPDILNASVTEGRNARVYVPLTDSIDINLLDLGSVLVRSKPHVNDSIDISIADVFLPKARFVVFDTLNHSVTESVSSRPAVQIHEALGVQLTEVLSFKTHIVLAESLGVAAVDVFTLGTRFLLTESLGVQLVESLPIKAHATLAETLGIRALDSLTLRSHINLSDSLRIAANEALTPLKHYVLADTLAVAAVEQVKVKSKISLAETIDILVNEASATGYHISVIDTVDLQTLETLGLVLGQDLIRIAIDSVMGISERSLIGVW